MFLPGSGQTAGEQHAERVRGRSVPVRMRGLLQRCLHGRRGR